MSDMALPLMRFTNLEFHSCLLQIEDLNILVDPFLMGTLAANPAWLYEAWRKNSNFKLQSLPEIHAILISQSLQDHCHVPTLQQLSQLFPSAYVIAPFQAKLLLADLFANVNYMKPGDSRVWKGITVHATEGARALPWHFPFNGYLLEVEAPKFTIYIEPHGSYDWSLTKTVDVIVAPVVRRAVPGLLELISGPQDAVKIAKLLQSKFFIIVDPGDTESRGFLKWLIRSTGSTEEFKDLLAKEMPATLALESVPEISLDVLKNA